MGSRLPQPCFSSGEIDPVYHGRVDLDLYRRGLALCSNTVVRRSGGVRTRTGTTYCGDAHWPGRLMPFVFNREQAYVLEFTDYVMRVYMNGALVVRPLVEPSALHWHHSGSGTNEYYFLLNDVLGTPIDFPLPMNGDLTINGVVSSQGTVGALAAGEWGNGDTDALGYMTIYVRLPDGTDPDTKATGYVSTVCRVTSPYAVADLPLVNYAQSADTMYLTHTDYRPRKLIRSDHWDWAFSVFDTASIAGPPGDLEGSFAPALGAYTATARYMVAAMDQGGRESDPSGEVRITVNRPFGPTGRVSLKWYLLTAASGYAWVLSPSRTVSRRSAAYKWTISGHGTNEYRLELAAGGDPGVTLPDYVLQNNLAMPGGALGALAAGQWGYGDNDVLGYSTIYVRLTDGTDPDTKAAGYVRSTDAAEFYLTAAGGGPSPITLPPRAIYVAGVEQTAGTIGALTEGSWVWGNADGLAAPTVYVRLVADADPGVTGTLTYRPYAHSRYVVYKNMQGQYGYCGETESSWFEDDDIQPDYLFAPVLNQTMFAAAGEYPAAVALFQQRTTFSGSEDQPLNFWASQSSDYENYALSNPIRDTDSMEFTLASGLVDPIYHTVPLGAGIFVFTLGSEWLLTGQSQESLTPNSVSFTPLGTHGCPDHPAPLVVGSNLVYLERGAGALWAMGDIGKDQLELSLYSAHMLRESPVVSWAWQQAPDRVLWMVREDGALLGCTLSIHSEIIAWHRHETQGQFLSCCSIPSLAGGEDEVYFLVERTIGGGLVYYVEKLAPIPTTAAGDIPFDCSLVYSGAPATVISGLGHLEGATVYALADGLVCQGLTVTAGQVTVPVASSVVTVGLPFTSSVTTLPLDSGGGLLGRRVKVSRVSLRFFDSREVRVGPTLTNTDPLKWRTDEAWGAGTEWFTGDKQLTIPQTWGQAAQVSITTTGRRFEILSLTPEIVTGE